MPAHLIWGAGIAGVCLTCRSIAQTCGAQSPLWQIAHVQWLGHPTVAFIYHYRQSLTHSLCNLKCGVVFSAVIALNLSILLVFSPPEESETES